MMGLKLTLTSSQALLPVLIILSLELDLISAFSPVSRNDFNSNICKRSNTRICSMSSGENTVGGRASSTLFIDDESTGSENIDNVLDHLPFGESSSGESSSYHSFLDDGHGHINPELAQSIWDWDNEHRLSEEGDIGSKTKFPAAELKYSTRDGLRLVDKIARDLLPDDSSDLSYSDLVQEGVVALMRAMTTFDPSEDKENMFEAYAKKSIIHEMTKVLTDTSRPINIPSHVYETLVHAKRARDNLRSKYKNKREPTLAEVASRIGVAAEKLSLYQLVSRGALSVESTVEIYDPNSNYDNPATFTDLDTYEAVTGKEETRLFHSGEEDLNTEEEEDWVEQDKIVAPLRDFIADRTNQAPDDFALTDMIRHDVDDFLTSSTLDPQELYIIRMRYGLDAGKSLPVDNVGRKLGMTADEVTEIELRALQKLRTSFQNSFLGAYLDDDHSEEVTV